MTRALCKSLRQIPGNSHCPNSSHLRQFHLTVYWNTYSILYFCRRQKRLSAIPPRGLCTTSGGRAASPWATSSGWPWRTTCSSPCTGPSPTLRTACWKMRLAAPPGLRASAPPTPPVEPPKGAPRFGAAGAEATRSRRLKSSPNSATMRSNLQLPLIWKRYKRQEIICALISCILLFFQ